MTKEMVLACRETDGFSLDPLKDLLRQRALDLIAQAIEAELNVFLAAQADQTYAAGCKRMVRQGQLPEPGVQTVIGTVTVKVGRVRERVPCGALRNLPVGTACLTLG